MSDAVNLELAEGETIVTDDEELALRQIVEWMAPEGVILTHVFGPSQADRGKPSYSRSSVISPQDARDAHNRIAHSRSIGVWAVSVREVVAAGRLVIDDQAAALPEGEARPLGHCFVDFRGLPKADIKSIRYLLWLHAIARGELPTEDTLPDGQLVA